MWSNILIGLGCFILGFLANTFLTRMLLRPSKEDIIEMKERSKRIQKAKERSEQRLTEAKERLDALQGDLELEQKLESSGVHGVDQSNRVH